MGPIDFHHLVRCIVAGGCFGNFGGSLGNAGVGNADKSVFVALQEICFGPKVSAYLLAIMHEALGPLELFDDLLKSVLGSFQLYI